MSRPIVIQSFHTAQRPSVIDLAINTVSSWAQLNQYEYLFFGDEAIELLPIKYRKNCSGRLPMMMDLARLFLIRQLLDKNANQVIWIDADVLVFAPERFSVSETLPQMVGREIWVSKTKTNTWKARRHVHNAVLSFKKETRVLDFLIYATERIGERLQTTPSPQLLGPKLFTHLHNMVDFPVLETAGMMSPQVMSDLLQGNGPALDCHLCSQKENMMAVNLSHSLVGTNSDGVQVTEKFLLNSSQLLMERFSKNGLCRP